MLRIVRAITALVFISGVAATQQPAATPAAATAAVKAPKSARNDDNDKRAAALRAQSTVSEEAARATALAAVPGAVVKSAELEKEKGKLIWSFDLKVEGKKGVEEVQVDAVTGKIVSKEHESDAAEKAETRAERTNKAARKP